MLLCCLLLGAAVATVTEWDLMAVWVVDQRAHWERLTSECSTVVLLFTDAQWWPLTRALLGDMRRFGSQHRCAAIWFWDDEQRAQYHASTVASYTAMEAMFNPHPRAADFVDYVNVPLLLDRRCKYANESHEPSFEPAWGSPRYFDKIGDRVRIARRMHDLVNLVLHRHMGVAVFDSDIVLQRNVLARLEREDAFFVAQSETACSGGRAQCINGGFWRLAAGATHGHFLSVVELLMQHLNVPDQDAFDIALARHADHGRVVYLDKLLYANGHTYRHDARWRRNAAHIVHVNWGSGGLAEKKRLLAQLRGHAPDYYDSQ